MLVSILSGFNTPGLLLKRREGSQGKIEGDEMKGEDVMRIIGGAK